MKKRPLIPVLAVVALLVWLSTYTVREGEYAIVTRFGKPQATVEEAGLHFKLPAPIDAVVPVDMRLHMLDPETYSCLTQDKKNLLVDSFLVWSVDDPLKFYTSVTTRAGAEARLTDILRSVVGDVMSSYDFSELVADGNADGADGSSGGDGPGDDDDADAPSGLSRVAADLERLTRARAAETLGVAVHAAQVKRLNFPDQNKRAVFQRMETERQAISAGYRADGKEQYDKIKAQTDREESQMLSEARRTAAEIRGAAEAEAARIYADAYNADRELYTFLRSLEAAQKALGDDSLIVLPADHPLFRVMNELPELDDAQTEDEAGRE